MDKQSQHGEHAHHSIEDYEAIASVPETDDDDLPLGRILSRREILSLLGFAGSALIVTACAPSLPGSVETVLPPEGATAASPTIQAEVAVENATAVALNDNIQLPACVVRPEVTEGPYYLDIDLLRSDIREDREGAPLQLTFNVTEVSESSCTPLEGATVEVWHCDADGVYSGVSDPGFNTSGQTWLRGGQVTDVNGVATFTTIYPGWYSSRAVHIHFKIHPTEDLVFTSQLFFSDAFTEGVFAQEPYVSKGLPDTTNATDNIYQDLLLLDPVETADVYAAVFNIGIDLSTVGAGNPGGFGPGGAPPSRP